MMIIIIKIIKTNQLLWKMIKIKKLKLKIKIVMQIKSQKIPRLIIITLIKKVMKAILKIVKKK